MSGTPIRPPTITVRLFAGLREQAGWAEQRLVLPGAPLASTPAGLWRALGLQHGGAGSGGSNGGEALPPTIRVAVNQVFASACHPLQPGDEVAFLPPISGG
jgi:molybdopterin synthase sulfur carrier subunit